jgi:nicotinamide-nucleotide amidase
MARINATIITIGDELLIGQVIDTNSAWMAQRLNELGIDVLRRVAVGDSRDAILNALDEELLKCDVLLLTGGLGPTADDITKPLLCYYFGGEMVVDQKVLEHVKNIFERRKRPMLERNLKQAEVPDNCTVLFNRMGTAPGMWFEKNGKIVISLPGVPFEMMAIMEDEVLPKLQHLFVSEVIQHRSIITAGEGESFVAERIKDLEEALPSHIKLAYLPSYGIVRLRLTGHSNDSLRLSKEIQLRQEEIANRLENIVISLQDIPLEQLVGKTLVEAHATLGLAESCTGGNIAHLLTQSMGATNYFKGGIVCYFEEIKKNVLNVNAETLTSHGVVSEATATEMVNGALNILASDYALAITGLLSGSKDSFGTEPGTVWIAIKDKHRTYTKKIQLYYDRIRNKEMATQMAMLYLWRFINNKV